MEKSAFYQELNRIRESQKLLAIEIRKKKDQRKGSPDGVVDGLRDARQVSRIMHIVYCLARGRTLGQIESSRLTKPPAASNVDEYYLRKYVAGSWKGSFGTDLPDTVWTEVSHAVACPCEN